MKKEKKCQSSRVEANISVGIRMNKDSSTRFCEVLTALKQHFVCRGSEFISTKCISSTRTCYSKVRSVCTEANCRLRVFVFPSFFPGVSKVLVRPSRFANVICIRLRSI